MATQVVAPANTADTNRKTIEQRLAEDLVKLQAILDDTNANINSSPASRIKDLARNQKRLTRLALRAFDGVD